MNKEGERRLNRTVEANQISGAKVESSVFQLQQAVSSRMAASMRRAERWMRGLRTLQPRRAGKAGFAIVA
jgi:hypothetical protein